MAKQLVLAPLARKPGSSNYVFSFETMRWADALLLKLSLAFLSIISVIIVVCMPVWMQSVFLTPREPSCRSLPRGPSAARRGLICTVCVECAVERQRNASKRVRPRVAGNGVDAPAQPELLAAARPGLAAAGKKGDQHQRPSAAHQDV
jgi:hypothetical protein